MNELYVIVFAKKGTMVGRLAYKTLQEALDHIDRSGGTSKYRIERYLPAPLKEVKDHG